MILRGDKFPRVSTANVPYLCNQKRPEIVVIRHCDNDIIFRSEQVVQKTTPETQRMQILANAEKGMFTGFFYN